MKSSLIKSLAAKIACAVPQGFSLSSGTLNPSGKSFKSWKA